MTRDELVAAVADVVDDYAWTVKRATAEHLAAAVLVTVADEIARRASVAQAQKQWTESDVLFDLAANLKGAS